MTLIKFARFVAPVTLVMLMSVSGAVAISAQSEFPQEQGKDQGGDRTDVSVPTPNYGDQLAQLRRAAVRLPIAAGLAVILAMRPRRKGTPHRKAAVIQTQVILAIIGAVVMLVVGSSLARA